MTATLTWPTEPRTQAIVAQAQAEGYPIRPCEACGGPEIPSRIRAIARCFRCGRLRETRMAAPKQKRIRCAECRKYFTSVVAYLKCPACRTKRAYQEDAPEAKVRRQGED